MLRVTTWKAISRQPLQLILSERFQDSKAILFNKYGMKNIRKSSWNLIVTIRTQASQSFTDSSQWPSRCSHSLSQRPVCEDIATSTLIFQLIEHLLKIDTSANLTTPLTSRPERGWQKIVEEKNITINAHVGALEAKMQTGFILKYNEEDCLLI